MSHNGARHLVVVAKEPWGNVDFLELCKLASDEGIIVHYIGTDGGRSQYFEPNIVKLPALGGLRFSILASREIKRICLKYRGQGIAVHVRYYKLCSTINILNAGTRRHLIVDVRSASIKPNAVVRNLENLFIGMETATFAKRTIISKAVAALLGIERRYIELPVGAPERFLEIRKATGPSAQLKFIYIGTLRQRNIYEFVEAFARFTSQSGLRWSLDVYGSGDDRDISRLMGAIGNSSEIRFHGYIDRKNIPDALSVADIGVSWIPITKYFDHQPPTKTYEYLLAGVPVLGTRTAANTEIIAPGYGWLCDDTLEGAMKAFGRIRDEEANWAFDRLDLQKYTWRSIFERIYKREVIGASDSL